jgi:hypothetical protein
MSHSEIMDNRFVDNLYAEFEDNLWEVLGFGIEGLRITLNRPPCEEYKGTDVDKELEEAFAQGGAPQLRWEMKNFIINVHYIFLGREFGRNPTYEEWVESMESFNVGIGRNDMEPSYLNGIETEAESKTLELVK